MKNTNWLLLIVVILVIVTVSFIFVSHHHYVFFDEKNRDALIVESAKALLQLTGIAALGGWVKYLYDKATEQRRQAEKANEMRKSLLDDLIAARSLVEESRRTFRVEKSTPEQYKKTILTILDARLKLSRIWNETESLEFLFSDHKKITKSIDAMKGYLDQLIGEYENRLSVSYENDSAAEINLPVFKKFLSDDPESDYIKDFLEGAYRPAVKEIRKNLLRASRANFNVEA